MNKHHMQCPVWDFDNECDDCCTCDLIDKVSEGKRVQGAAMTHDPLCDHDDLCPMKHEQFPKHPLENCWQCDLIAKVRQDERERAGIEQTVPSYEYPFSTAVTVEAAMTDMLRFKWTSFGPWLDEDGPFVRHADAQAAIAAAEADMLAKCVTTVEAMDIHGSHPYRGVVHCNCLGPQIVAALRALQEKP